MANRRDIDRLDTDVAELRAGVEEDIHEIKAAIVEIQKAQALQAQAMATGGQVVNKLIYIGVALAIIILGAALSVIAFGPSTV